MRVGANKCRDLGHLLMDQLRKWIMRVGIAGAVLLSGISLGSGSTGGFGPPDKVRIAVEKKTVRVGQPLMMKMSLIWEGQKVDSGLDEEIFHNFVVTAREQSDGGSTVRSEMGWLGDFRLEAGMPVTYSTNITVLYDFEQKRLMLPIEGIYVIEGRCWGRTAEPLRIKVEPPTEAERRALGLLTGPDDYNVYGVLYFGEGPSSNVEEEKRERIKAIETLKRVFEICPDSLMGRLAAARVGIELCRQVGRRHPRTREFMKAYRTGRITEPLVEEAYKYLSAALDLPDVVQLGDGNIREQALDAMITVELYKGNYEKCLAYADELRKKYPFGRFGRKAEENRWELEQLQSEAGSVSRTTEGVAQMVKPHHRGVVWAVVTACMILIGGVVATAVLYGRRKRKAG